jgi:hypothetical protein
MILKKEYDNILNLHHLNVKKNRIKQINASKLESLELTLTDLSTSKICVIYAYYERKNEQKNQKLLSQKREEHQLKNLLNQYIKKSM